MFKKIVIPTIATLLLLGGVLAYARRGTETILDNSTPIPAESEFPTSNLDGSNGSDTYNSTLSDVTEGREINGFTTNGNATGEVSVTLMGEQYKYFLAGSFKNLPVLSPDFFYEGWVVRTGNNPEAISTGKVFAVDNNTTYINEFGTDVDLTDHDLYVLTLEPDDGDPAPAAHILEGTLL